MSTTTSATLNAKEEVTAPPPPPPPPLQSTATTNVQQQQKSSALEFLSLTDEEFKAAVATAHSEGDAKNERRRRKYDIEARV